MGNYGAPDRIRTCGLCLRRAALYPAELRVHLGVRAGAARSSAGAGLPESLGAPLSELALWQFGPLAIWLFSDLAL